MAFDKKAYDKEYEKKKLVMVMVRLNKQSDSDIIDAIGDKNRAGNIKRLVRIGIGKTKEE